MWKKHKSLLFRKHIKTECLFWHAHGPCCLPLCFSVFFWELVPSYFPSTALTDSCFKSQSLCRSEPQSKWNQTCSQLLTTYRKAGWTISPGCTQEWDGLRSRIQPPSISFNHVNETAICIAFPNTLLHAAHAFSIYSPARPVTSLPSQHMGVPPAPDKAVPSEIAHNSVSEHCVRQQQKYSWLAT